MPRQFIKKNDIQNILKKYVKADVNKHPHLDEAVQTAFNSLAPDKIVREKDVAKVFETLTKKAHVNNQMIMEVVQRVVEASDLQDLRAVVNQFLERLKPQGYKRHENDVNNVIIQGKLRPNSGLSRIKTAVQDYITGPRTIDSISQEELQKTIRQELTKHGTIDNREVSQILNQYRKQFDPKKLYSYDDLAELVKKYKSPIKAIPGDSSSRTSSDGTTVVKAGPYVPPTNPRKKTFFETVRAKMERYGLRPLSRQARNWLNDVVRKAQVPSQSELFKRSVLETTMEEAFVGKMFFYSYNAKLKDVLPFWDAFPLIFVVDVYEDGWLGINLHYLPMALRITLFDALLGFADDESLDKIQRLRLSYSYLKSFSQFPLVKPCLKRYLAHYVQSSMLNVKPVDWEIAAWLPVERFQKQSKERVWAKSRAQSRGNKR